MKTVADINNINQFQAVHRPLLLKAAPLRLRQWLFYHFYRKRSHLYQGLFRAAYLDRATPFLMYDLVPTDHISQCIAFCGVFESRLSRLISFAARHEKGLMIDVGANMGYFSLLWLAGHPRNTAQAFEPVPGNIQRLTRNIERNQLSSRCCIYPIACGDKEETTEFDLGPSHQTGWGSIKSNDSANSAINVQVRRLEDLVAGSDISVLKIDTEGADPLVLRGAKRLLEAKRVARIYFEQNRQGLARFGLDYDEAPSLLERCGYRVSCLDNPMAPVSTWSAQR